MFSSRNVRFRYVTLRISLRHVLFKCCVASRLYAQRRVIFRNVKYFAVLRKVFEQRYVTGFVG